ncbi:CRISPR associated protein of unknown function [Chitinispirillum alkaliphilum]|nr:CRISPR associated protein of unknown function [Chitinispirillum alkaliphilum]
MLYEITVHPHAYGEHLRANLLLVKTGGSSPCIWGTYPPQSALISRIRFIPMHMGNIDHTPLLSRTTAVHPHAYGGTWSDGRNGLGQEGSSPCIWGTFLPPNDSFLFNRFIPMHMGNIRTRVEAKEEKAVHPHAYGEHCSKINPDCVGSGSSPCIWGTFMILILFRHCKRFIPMHMGNILPSP